LPSKVILYKYYVNKNTRKDTQITFYKIMNILILEIQLRSMGINKEITQDRKCRNEIPQKCGLIYIKR
jgi:hypothetical protein